MDSTSYRSNRQSAQSQQPVNEVEVAAPVPEAPAPERSHTRASKAKQPKNMPKLPTKLLAAVAIVVIILLGWWFFMRSSGVSGSIDGGKLQAVFFTNGQVYFGKLHVVNDDYLKLTEIYYLQAKTATTKDNPQQTSGGSASDVQLIKLGDEIHGPEDAMIFNKDQVLFFENLKSDGNVSKTISNYNKDK